jgi:agmatine deiminase
MKKILLNLLALIVLLMPVANAQDVHEIPVWKKMRYLSEEEMLLPHDNLKSFFPTDPPSHPVRMVAEYEHMQSVLVRYPFGIPVSLIAEMSQHCGVTTIVSNQSQQNTVTNIYQGSGVNMDNIDFIQAPSDSYWTRDYGPWFVIDGSGDFGVCNFPYNRPRPNDDDIPIAVANHLGIDLYGMPLEHTGGNWMCSGNSQASSTDLVWYENLSMTHQEIQDMVDDYLGVSTYHVLPDPLGDYIKHIDCWGKYLGVNKVLIGSVPVSDPRYSDFEYVADYYANTTSDWGMPYEVYRVYTPGNYPYTPYTNSLILNKKVFVPITGSSHDAAALAVYEEAMPGYEVIGVMHNTWENTDALHCRTKGIADLGMLQIRHMPLHGNVQLQDEYAILANITPYSGASLYADSIFLYYKTDGGNYQAVLMNLQIGNLYRGLIPYQDEGTLVNYYIHAADQSGRSANHPYIGGPDPHEFTVVQMLPGLIVEPDTLLYTDYTQALEGLQLSIYPEGDEDATITHINLEGTDYFYWWAEPIIDFPHVVPANDSLILTVFIGLTVEENQGFLQDTLFINAEGGNYQVLIMVDEYIISVPDHDQDKAVPDVVVYPNPFRENVQIRIVTETEGELKAHIYNQQGLLVADLSKPYIPRGEHIMQWNGFSSNGTACPAGIYYLRLIDESGGEYTARMIRIETR